MFTLPYSDPDTSWRFPIPVQASAPVTPISCWSLAMLSRSTSCLLPCDPLLQCFTCKWQCYKIFHPWNNLSACLSISGKSWVECWADKTCCNTLFISWETLFLPSSVTAITGSLRTMYEALRMRVLFDIFLNVPAGQVSFQILLHHKVHGCLTSQKHEITSQ